MIFDYMQEFKYKYLKYSDSNFRRIQAGNLYLDLLLKCLPIILI
jgi:hypothetical protein